MHASSVRRFRSSGALLLSACLLLAGCGGGSDDASPIVAHGTNGANAGAADDATGGAPATGTPSPFDPVTGSDVGASGNAGASTDANGDPVVPPNVDPVVDRNPDPASDDIALATDALPADCLSARTDDGTTFCFTAATRELLAVTPDGTPYWRFALPGTNASNRIEHVAFAANRLVLIAATDADTDAPGLEYSTFRPGGAFEATRTLWFGTYCCGEPDALLAVAGAPSGLLLAGRAEADAFTGQVARTELLRVDPVSGRTEALRTFDPASAARLDTSVPESVGFELDGVGRTLDPLRLGDVPADGLVSAGTYETLRLRADRWLEADFLNEVERLVRRPELLASLEADALSIDATGAAVHACPGGGEVAGGRTDSSSGYSALTLRFDTCALDDLIVDGRLERGGGSSFATAYEYRSGSARYDALALAFDDGRHITVTGTTETDGNTNNLLNGCPGNGSASKGGYAFDRVTLVDATGATTITGLRGERDARYTKVPTGTYPGGSAICEDVADRTSSASATVTSPLFGDASATLSKLVDVHTGPGEGERTSTASLSASFGAESLEVELLDATAARVRNVLESAVGSMTIEDVWAF